MEVERGDSPLADGVSECDLERCGLVGEGEERSGFITMRFGMLREEVGLRAPTSGVFATSSSSIELKMVKIM